MKIQEVILRALSGEIHWFQAAEILGMSIRTLRRYRAGLESGVTRVCSIVADGRLATERAGGGGEADPGAVPRAYRGWNVRHFYQTVCREHGVKVSYTFVKQALQVAGLVKKHKARGRHRRRRERKAVSERCSTSTVASTHGWR